MKPIVLNFDEDNYKNELSRVESVKEKMQSYVDEISGINGIKFTPELFADLLRSGNQVADAIKESASKQLATAGITSASVREAAIKGDTETFYRIQQRMQRDSILTHLKNYLSVKSGKVIIPEAGYKEIERQFTWGIETEKGKALYDAHIAMIESINRFLEEAGVGAMYLPQYYSGHMTGGGKIEPTQVDYDKLAKQTA